MVGPLTQTPSSGQQDVACVSEIVSTKGEIERTRLVDRIARRNGGDRTTAHRLIGEAVAAGLVYEATRHEIRGRATSRVVVRPGAAPPDPGELLPHGAFLRLFVRAHMSESKLARELGVTQPRVSTWVCEGGIPPAWQERLQPLLTEAATTRLRRERDGVGQRQLADRLGWSQGSVSKIETDPAGAPDEVWAALERAIAEMKREPVRPPPDLGRPLIARELRRLVREARARGLSQHQAARLIGVTHAVLSSWAHERKPIPQARRRRIRAVLRYAQPRLRCEPLGDVLLPAVVALVRRHGPMLRVQVERMLSGYGDGAVRQAIDLAIATKRVQIAPAVITLPSGRRREYLALHRGGVPPVAKPRDRVAEVLAAAEEMIVRHSGESARAIADRLPADGPVARAAVARAIALGRAHTETVYRVDAAGRRCSGEGVYPGPIASERAVAPVLAGELGEHRQRLAATRPELASLLSRELGVSRASARKWQSTGISAAWADDARALLAATAELPHEDRTRKPPPDPARVTATEARELLEASGLRQSEACELVGASRGLFSEWLAGKKQIPRRWWEPLRALPEKGRLLEADALPGAKWREMRGDRTQEHVARLVGVNQIRWGRWEASPEGVPREYRARARNVLEGRDALPVPRWARQLQAARTKAGMTTQQLADRLGVSRPSVYAMESGRVEPPEERRRAVERLLAGTWPK
jgi:transcriptional regulator with XRE-family HTH domain